MRHVLSLYLLATLMSSQALGKEYLIKVRSETAVASFYTQEFYQVQDYHAPGKLVKVNIPESQKVNAVVNILSNPQVEYMVPNVRLHTFSAPVDIDALKEQYAITKVRGNEAWAKAGNKGSKQVVVAVIDTGVDYRHKDLSPNMIAGYDFAGRDNDPMDETGGQNPGHGTHCAGVIGATGLVNDGIVGLSPEVSIMPLRFLDKNGGGDLDNGVKSIDYAIEKKVDVISASWGAAVPRNTAIPLIEAVKRAEEAGIIFVVASGNDGKNNDSYEVYPANAGLSNTISVAASNSKDTKPSWSNFGRGKVHISSPGEAIMSTLPKDKYGNLSGTSMATPLVAGLVAFVKAQNPNLSPYELRSLLQSSGTQVSIQTACDCRIDALNAIETVLDKKMFVHPFAGTFSVTESVPFTGIYGQAPLTFSVSNPQIATIDEEGVLKALKEGEVQVTVQDSSGQKAISHKIYFGKASTTPGNPPPNPGNPGNPGEPELPVGDCPLGDEMLCQIACQIFPEAPWCQQ